MLILRLTLILIQIIHMSNNYFYSSTIQHKYIEIMTSVIFLLSGLNMGKLCEILPERNQFKRAHDISIYYVRIHQYSRPFSFYS